MRQKFWSTIAKLLSEKCHGYITELFTFFANLIYKLYGYIFHEKNLEKLVSRKKSWVVKMGPPSKKKKNNGQKKIVSHT